MNSPIDLNHKLGEAKGDTTIDREMYQRLVDQLIYISQTRPNIAYIVSVVSQFMHNLMEIHLEAVYRVLHYLNGLQEKEYCSRSM